MSTNTTTKPKILVVEDNLLVSAAVQDILTEEGMDVLCVDTGKDAKDAVRKDQFQAILLDMMLPDANGKDLLVHWRKEVPDLPVVVMTAHADVPTAVECTQLGAYDFLTKPVERPHLVTTIRNAMIHQRMADKVAILEQLVTREVEPAQMGDVIAASPAMLKSLDMVKLVAQSDFSTALIRGESGTGKGLLARTIHKMGSRKGKPFVEINCSALPANLIESELFGHRKGAFTDAKEEKIGLFEMADGGTLFLDEIGDMDFTLQAKLLKVLEDQRFRRIGGTTDITVNVQIIAATNQNLETLVQENKFRLDLFYRLNVIPIDLPPLRERPEDIRLLSDHFLKYFARKFGKPLQGFSPAVVKLLSNYTWPGNVREFRNVIERGCILSRGLVIDNPELLFPGPLRPVPVAQGGAPLSVASPIPSATPTTLQLNPTGQIDPNSFPAMKMVAVEKLAILAAMREAKNNRNQAAKILDIHRTTLYKKLDEYELAASSE